LTLLLPVINPLKAKLKWNRTARVSWWKLLLKQK
jgi:hypothetical protein